MRRVSVYARYNTNGKRQRERETDDLVGRLIALTLHAVCLICLPSPPLIFFPSYAARISSCYREAASTLSLSLTHFLDAVSMNAGTNDAAAAAALCGHLADCMMRPTVMV